MSFDYDKLKEKHETQSHWATYSDLFMVLSLVFLLLYTTSSIRTGTFSLQQNIEYQRVTELNEDLKQQIKVYNTLKDNYLETSASESEMETYSSLMDKLDLLKEETKDEKEKLTQQIADTRQKEKALNQYQQIVRNIVNSNLMAKAKIRRQDVRVAELSTEKSKISRSLKKTKSELTVTQKQLEAESKAKTKLVSKLGNTKQQYQDKLNRLKESQKEKEKQNLKAFKEKLNKQKLSVQAKEEALKKYQAKVSEDKKSYQKKLASLNSKISDSEDELRKAKARLNARKALAKRIQSNFKKAGVDAQVDSKTGDVILNFGEEYFDTGKHALKPGMRQQLQQSIPIYAKSLFEDKKTADKLSFVEIVGFASPTYNGKYVDPQSMDAKDKAAINYNLDLSYYRARSIFDHIFDQSKMTYGHQKRLRSIVKVTGRSFLAEKVSKGKRVPAGMSQREFCAQYDCKKAQRVIIKFDLED